MRQELEYLRQMAQEIVDAEPNNPDADMVICACDLLKIIEEREWFLNAARGIWQGPISGDSVEIFYGLPEDIKREVEKKPSFKMPRAKIISRRHSR